MDDRSCRIGIDVGGTFTDATLVDLSTGRLAAAKAFTTPGDRSIGVMDAIRAVLAEAGVGPERIREVVHGSTTGTNALIERTGARTALLTTEGFRDLLEIGRVMRPMAGLYDMSVDRPPPLVPRHLVAVASERVGADGGVLTPLDEDSVRTAAARFAAEAVEAVAVCFLFAFRNPAHELRAAEILSECLPGVAISLSHRISPEYREYERASTTAMNAYLTPVMNAYLDRLSPRLESELGKARLFVIQANGGATTVESARERSVATVNSGPAGGVVAAAWYGRKHERARLVSVDMGGTSFDIGLVEDFKSQITTEGEFQGLPVKLPIIELHIIGAGGGSIAAIDRGGALEVGPRSAGAEPGPACYGRGGILPTVTDANLVLGRLSPKSFHSGRSELDPAAARAAVAPIAAHLGLTPEEAALGIIQVVNANMAKGIATVTVQRGIDVRDLSLLSFGGAAGVHAVDLGRDLEMAEVIIPPFPGVFSALGLLVADVRHDYVAAFPTLTGEADPAALGATFAHLEAEARAALAADGFGAERMRLERSADLKVQGQTYELNVPMSAEAEVTQGSLGELVQTFARRYRERYAFFFDDEPIEIVNVRLSAFGVQDPVTLAEPEAASGPPPGERPVYFAGRGWTASQVFARAALRPGQRVEGPAVIEDPTSTLLLPPGEIAEVASDLGLFIGLKP